MKGEIVNISPQPSALPAWLVRASVESMLKEPIPLREILDGALYYPSCGSDGGPVKNLGLWYQSFVYVDYRYAREDFLKQLVKTPFSGYEIMGMRSVSMSELAPHGWNKPKLTKTEAEQVDRYASHRAINPFCEWVIFERDAVAPSSHGPERFSLLYLNQDGATTYNSIYVENGLCAGAIAVIQPGHAFGFNWTDFTNPQAVLARTVMGNPIGTPELYLSGGMGPRKYLPDSWPIYKKNLGWYAYGDSGSVGIWKRSE